ncbi:hypothetical protein [Hyphococcus sp.]|uniref:hypothetical protein n=2 Tax=Hyphococcus sp. TaxID=2038636 RepID=UPI0035C6742F
MMEPPRYTPPSKALIRDLSSDIRALARSRLAEQLQYYQTIKDLDDTDIADAMNDCAAVVGNRGTGEQVFAAISPKKIERFKDEAIRPQTNTLEQMTAFFEDKTDMPRFLAWADMDDVLTAYHDARRFRNERVHRKLIELAGGWIFISLFEPTAVIAIQLTQLSAHPVLVARGRIFLKSETKDTPVYINRFLHGFATLTPSTLTLTLRGHRGKQYSVHIDLAMGPLEGDQDDEPYLILKQVKLNLPSEFSVGFHPLYTRNREFISRRDYALHLSEKNLDDPNRPRVVSSFALSDQDVGALVSDGRKINIPMDKFGLLSADPIEDEDDLELSCMTFGKQVDDLRHLLQVRENLRTDLARHRP